MASVRQEPLADYALTKAYPSSASTDYTSRQRIGVASSPFFSGFTDAAWSYPSLTLIGSCPSPPKHNHCLWATLGDDAEGRGRHYA